MTWTGKTAEYEVLNADRQGSVPLWSEYVEPTTAERLLVADLDRQGSVPLWSEAVADPVSFSISKAEKVNTTPYVKTANLNPAPSEIDVDPVTVVVGIPIGDVVPETEYGVDAAGSTMPHPDTEGVGVYDSQLKIYVDQGSGFAVIYQNGAAQGGWGVSKPTNDEYGFDYAFTPPPGGLTPNQLITVKVELYDYTNTFTCYEYTFETGSSDPNPPWIIDALPVPNSSTAEKDDPLSFTIADDVTGVAPDTIVIYVRGLMVYRGSTGERPTGWRGTIVANTLNLGFDLVFYPDREYQWYDGEVVNVRAVARDYEGNLMDTTWQFAAVNKPFRTRVYQMLLRSIRKFDES